MRSDPKGEWTGRFVRMLLPLNQYPPCGRWQQRRHFAPLGLWHLPKEIRHSPLALEGTVCYSGTNGFVGLIFAEAELLVSVIWQAEHETTYPELVSSVDGSFIGFAEETEQARDGTRHQLSWRTQDLQVDTSWH